MAYENYCGPAVVATLLQVERGFAGKLLKCYKPAHRKRVRASTSLEQIRSVLVNMFQYKAEVKQTFRQEKLGRFLSTNYRLAIVRVKEKTGHFILVNGARVLEDNKVDSYNKTVTHVLYLSK